MIEVGSLVCLCALHLTLKCKLGLLGHHASKCAIDGPGVEAHAPLSPLHDRGCVRAYICLRSHAIHCLSFVAVKIVFCRKFLPTGNIQCQPAICEWPIASSAADGHSSWPVGISSSRWYSTVCKERVPGLWQSLERQDSENRGSSGMVRIFWARRIEHALFAYLEAGLRPFPFCIYLLNN